MRSPFATRRRTSNSQGILIQDVHSKVETDPNIFSPAGKFDFDPPWTISSGVNGPAQNELTNVGIYALKPGDIGNTDSWMIMMMERTKQQGTFDLDFEINQVPWDGASGTLVRTPGDVAAAFELKGNPTDPQADLEVIILVYDPDRDLDLCGPGPGACGSPDSIADATQRCSATFGPGGKVVAVGEGSGTCPDYPPGDPSGYVYRFRGPATALGSFGRATMNALPFAAPPWGSLDSGGSPRTTIPAFHFAEAALNLTALGIDPGCPGFGSIHAKTRSSIEATSDLKDLAGPAALPVECSIHGTKFEDTNGDGSTAGEPGLGDWTINLYKDDDDGVFEPGADDELLATTTTCTAAQVADDTHECFGESVGDYWFMGLDDGDYWVEEECPANWIQTVPGPQTDEAGCGDNVIGPITIDITNTTSEDNDFANFELNTKSGHKFEDVDGDGDLTDTVNPLSGWTINLYADENSDGALDGGDTLLESTTTNASGEYEFDDLAPGDYLVEEECPANWIQTVPGPQTTEADCGDNVIAFTVDTSGEDHEDNDFGNFELVEKRGTKFEDVDGDGDLTDDVNPLENWTIVLYEDDGTTSGVLDAGDILLDSTTTNASGEYSFDDLAPGDYLVEEECPANWIQTVPGPQTDEAGCGDNVIAFTVDTSGEDHEDNDFGNFELNTKSGHEVLGRGRRR